MRTRRHIIVEGMDGSGKDRLIRELMDNMNLPGFTVHERASTSLGGPVADLAEWTVNDVLSMGDQPKSIYNRHPLVSEPIYAPIRKVNPGLAGVWRSEVWVKTYQRLVAREAVLVVCQPPFPEVRKNLEATGPQGHMPGVYDNMMHLYDTYKELVWPGLHIRYDYMLDTPDTLVTLLNRMMP